MKRRDFLRGALYLGLGYGFFPLGCGFKRTPLTRKKVLVIGIDGMDTHLSSVYMGKGLLPNFKRLVQKGGMRAVSTSMPPQSPVAWSNFIVGGTTQAHGIYDFIHRNPKSMLPYLSTSSVTAPETTFGMGEWNIPLSAGKTENLMKGKPFWSYLAERDIPTTLFKMPANFPCEGDDKVEMASGMGTPDLRGGYGNFTLFTTNPTLFKKDMSGGKVMPVTFQGQRLKTHLPGPANTLKKGTPEISVPIEIWRDRDNPLVRILIQGNEFLLKKGEWTGWFQVSFPLIGGINDIKGICKIYIKSVHPDFTMYVSPINIDPSDPALPVVSPRNYGAELVRNVGYFYTQGFPEDTKALSEGVLSEKEYLDLAYQIIDERNRLLDYELKRFAKQPTGMSFFYFSSLDQDTHMYWRSIDRKHPLYDKELNKKYGNTLKRLYAEMDKMLGNVLSQFDINDPNFTLMVMSDHGFVPFRRQVNINSWLHENSYLSLNRPKRSDSKGYFEKVNWSKTAAYNVGINSIYLNLRERERFGVVPESRAMKLREDIRRDLLKFVDPDTGEKAISKVWIVPESERRFNDHAPDLIVGWNYGYRNSWDSILGGFSRTIISDNLDKWSGDHCVDPRIVPAVLFSNKTIKKENPSLCDITATILDEFNISPGNEMEGKSLNQS